MIGDFYVPSDNLHDPKNLLYSGTELLLIPIERIRGNLSFGSYKTGCVYLLIKEMIIGDLV